MSVLHRVVSYLAAKTEEPATAAFFWRLLTFILHSVCSAPYAYGLFCQESASRSWGLPLSLVGLVEDDRSGLWSLMVSSGCCVSYLCCYLLVFCCSMFGCRLCQVYV